MYIKCKIFVNELFTDFKKYRLEKMSDLKKNIDKKKLREFIKETCKIGEKGKLLKILLKLK